MLLLQCGNLGDGYVGAERLIGVVIGLGKNINRGFMIVKTCIGWRGIKGVACFVSVVCVFSVVSFFF